MGAFSDFEDKILVGAYLIADETGEDFIRLREITQRFVIDYNPNWLERALRSLVDSGLSDDAGHLGGDPLDQPVSLTPRGFKRGEELADYIKLGNRISADITEQLAVGDAIVPEVPASDRIVSFDHNSQAYKEIASGISEIQEAVRGTNGLQIDSAERDRILQGLAAARNLWDATQLKIIQVKIGVLLAIEDAGSALKTTAKAVAAALLVDAVKAFVKSHTGIDLDHI